MKKLNKKQKLIIFISIILIAIIIGIAVSINVIRINIANGKYNTANSNSSSCNLLPEYIKEGITLGGVTGTLVDLDTSDATATAADIVLGKTAYVNGVKITGTYEEIVPDLNSNNTTFTQDINYWTNQDVNVNVRTTISGYTLQLATGAPNVESNWHNATSQRMTANGTIYARLTNGRKSGGWTSYDVTNIDKVLPYAGVRETMAISRIKIEVTPPYQSTLRINNIHDDDSGIAKLVFYYRSDAQTSFTKGREYNLAEINGMEEGRTDSLSYTEIADFTEEEFTGHDIYMYMEAYDVAGNRSVSYLAWINEDGTQTSYTQQ